MLFCLDDKQDKNYRPEAPVDRQGYRTDDPVALPSCLEKEMIKKKLKELAVMSEQGSADQGSRRWAGQSRYRKYLCRRDRRQPVHGYTLGDSSPHLLLQLINILYKFCRRRRKGLVDSSAAGGDGGGVYGPKVRSHRATLLLPLPLPLFLPLPQYGQVQEEMSDPNEEGR